MTDKEIIKALECCIKSECSECPLKRSFCSESVAMEYALNLINRQQVEIERWRTSFEWLRNVKIPHIIKDAKIEAYKEFAERLKLMVDDSYVEHDIDNLVKELTEGGNND